MNQPYQFILGALILNLVFSCSSNDEVCVEKVWYIDADADGFGYNGYKLKACEKPDGYVENNKDCNDSLSFVHPNASETYNYIDDNCNDVIDECGTDVDCMGTCENGVCVGNSTPFSYEFSKFYFNHDLTGTDVPYHFFEPKRSSNTDDKFPLIITLHGFEYFIQPEDSFLTDVFAEIAGYFALGWIKEDVQSDYPAYVVAPHIHNDLFDTFNGVYPDWKHPNAVDFVEKLLDSLISDNPNLDEKRIYMAGHSMGGIGTWYIGSALKDKIAALVPLSPAFSETGATYNILEARVDEGDFNELPTWCFIHRTDANGNAGGSRELFHAIQDNGLSTVYTHWVGDTNYDLSTTQIENAIDRGIKYFYTEYNYSCASEGDCHFAMTHALREPSLFKWLFQQKKGLKLLSLLLKHFQLKLSAKEN